MLPLTRSKVALVMACALLRLGVPGRATILLVNDSFSDGERSTQNSTGSQWFTGGATSNVSVTNGALNFADASGAKATILSYFSSTTLEVNQSLTLSFSYNFGQISNGDNNFMFGLYNSGGSYVTKDNTGLNSFTVGGYTGYAASGVFGNDPSGPGRDHIEVRDKVGNNLRSISFYNEGPETIQSGGATPGEWYDAVLQIARTAEGITVTSTIGTTTISQTYGPSSYATFDTVGIFDSGNTGTFALDNISVSYSGAPEPTPLGALLAMGLMISAQQVKQVLARRAFSGK